MYQIHLNRVTDLILTACRKKEHDERKQSERKKCDTRIGRKGKEFVCRLSGGVEIAMKSTRTWLCTFMRTRFRKVIRLWVALPYTARWLVCVYVICVSRVCEQLKVYFWPSFTFFFSSWDSVLVSSALFSGYALSPPQGKWRRRSPFANSIQRNVSTE